MSKGICLPFLSIGILSFSAEIGIPDNSFIGVAFIIFATLFSILNFIR